jgi:hypothetical protein
VKEAATGFAVAARPAANFGAVVRPLAAGLAALACAATLAGCGGGDGDGERRSEPRKIPSAAAGELADRSEAVADKIDAGDVCAAAHEADALEDRVEQLIAEGKVPQRYHEELRAEAVWLRDNVNCPQPKPEEEKEEKDADKKGENGGKGKGNGGDDSGSVTVETTVTLEQGE